MITGEILFNSTAFFEFFHNVLTDCLRTANFRYYIKLLESVLWHPAIIGQTLVQLCCTAHWQACCAALHY